MYHLEPEEEDFCISLDWDGIYTEETFGDRLRLFYNQFSSSTRALLDEALFREVFGATSASAEVNTTITGLEILCSNNIIHKRLVQKHQKIGNEIRWIWPETVIQFAVGIDSGIHESTRFSQVFQLPEYWLK